MPRSTTRKVKLPCPRCGKIRLVQYNKTRLNQLCRPCSIETRPHQIPQTNNAIIEVGNPKCKHQENITNDPEYKGHLIGRCKHCGRVIDYTILQARFMNDRPARYTTLERVFR